MIKSRLAYIDNIRLIVIIFAVLVHIAVTYSGFGIWAYNELGEIGVFQTLFFGFFQAITQGYAMGLLFMIAGYFTPKSYDKKGFGKFLKDRLFRLGIPTLISMLIITPMTYLIVNTLGESTIITGSFLTVYAEYITNFSFIGGSGPLWFAFALLIFSVIYALIRKFIVPKAVSSDKDIPAFPKILAFILLISICTFLVRIVQPVGTDVINFQLPHFSHYIAMFIIGIKCRRNNWFEKLDYIAGKRWFIWGLSLGFVLFVSVLLLGSGPDGDLSVFDGGATWQSAAYSLWESFIVVSMSIGLIALFKERFNYQNRLIKTMSANAFSVYAFHTPIIIVLTMLFAPVSMIPIAKFAIASLIAVPVCFLVTNFTIQKIPLLRKIYA